MRSKWWVWEKPDPKTYLLTDHLGGFNDSFRNEVLDDVPPKSTVYTEYLFPDEIKRSYPSLDLRFSAYQFILGNQIYEISKLAESFGSAPLHFPGFVSTFNKANNIGRHWLLAALMKQGWYDPNYCTKHFSLDAESLKLIDIDINELGKAAKKTSSFDFTGPTDHEHNLKTLSPKIAETFCHIVSETIIHSPIAFPTEKFLYPIVNKRLWVGFAAPWYHKIINQKFGFELYSCFDYSFDSMWVPHLRLKMLLQNLEKFYSMTEEEKQEVYYDQRREIEYNYNHLKSFDFLKRLTEIDEFKGGDYRYFDTPAGRLQVPFTKF